MTLSSARLFATAALAIVLLAPVNASSQQAYISRYDVYTGFAVIDSPALGLDEHNGFHVQGGINLRRWLSLGGDYSIASGSEHLTADLLPANLQAQINAAQAQLIGFGVLPANYHLSVPTDAGTQTFAAGPQLAYRRFSHATLFIRPSLGALRERAVPHPSDPFQQVVVAELAPAGFKRDWTGFYGVGGGADFTLSKHIGLRAQMDIVWNHPFNDILANGRWTFRSSIGTSYHFGRNTAAGK
jgi:hypothetical protein